MSELQDNPYSSPSELGKSQHRRRWSLAVRLFCWSLASLAMSVASVLAGFQHYSYLVHGFDFAHGDSHELALLTEPAFYWLIPALIFLATSILFGIASLSALVRNLARKG